MQEISEPHGGAGPRGAGISLAVGRADCVVEVMEGVDERDDLITIELDTAELDYKLDELDELD